MTALTATLTGIAEPFLQGPGDTLANDYGQERPREFVSDLTARPEEAKGLTQGPDLSPERAATRTEQGVHSDRGTLDER